MPDMTNEESKAYRVYSGIIDFIKWYRAVGTTQKIMVTPIINTSSKDLEFSRCVNSLKTEVVTLKYIFNNYSVFPMFNHKCPSGVFRKGYFSWKCFN